MNNHSKKKERAWWVIKLEKQNWAGRSQHMHTTQFNRCNCNDSIYQAIDQNLQDMYTKVWFFITWWRACCSVMSVFCTFLLWWHRFTYYYYVLCNSLPWTKSYNYNVLCIITVVIYLFNFSWRMKLNPCPLNSWTCDP